MKKNSEKLPSGQSLLKNPDTERLCIDCHVHTSRYSFCSSLDPDTACELAAARGIDVLVFTEHHRLWPRQDLARLQARHPRPRLFSGMEVSVAEGHDVLLIGPGLPQEVPSRILLDDLTRLLGPPRRGILAILAHPFRYTDFLDAAMAAVLDWVDAVEVNSVNILRSGYRRDDRSFRPRVEDLYRRAATVAGRRIYASDAHRPEAIGAVAGCLEADHALSFPDDAAALAALLKSVAMRERQDAALLGRLLEAGTTGMRANGKWGRPEGR